MGSGKYSIDQPKTILKRRNKMSHVKGQSLRNTIPAMLDTKIIWEEDEVTSENSIKIQVKDYDQDTNKRIYIKLYAPIIKQLGIEDRDRVTVGFNKDFSMFGIRKQDKGVMLHGNSEVLVTQSSSKTFNDFEEDTIWLSTPEKSTKIVGSDQVICALTVDDTLIEQRKNDGVWKTFLDSTSDHIKSYIK